MPQAAVSSHQSRTLVARIKIAGAFAIILFAALLVITGAREAAAAPNPESLLSAIVGINADIPGDARTSTLLGTHREGSGVVVSEDGLVLTIGYLILEASQIEIELQNGKKVPAELVAYDHDSGFGLIRALQPLNLPAIEFGNSDSLTVSKQALIATRLGAREARGVYIVSRREFTGSWEYLIDNAIFTAPPHANFSGAALLGSDGKLLGIGSLFVGNAASMNRPMPGNMFVPIEELKPIYAGLVANGQRSGTVRPWLGLYPSAVNGRVFVDRVAKDGPAERAGLETGDLIVAVEDTPVGEVSAFFKALWSSGRAGDTISLSVLSRKGTLRQVPVTSIDRTRWLRLKPSL